ncbi:unnamed protein product [Caenorhabditis nigoni]
MIFEEMTNVVLLLLSFGSFNVREMIKLTQRKRLNNIGRMVFCTGSPNEEVYISNIIYNQGKPVREIQEPILGIVGGYMNVKKDWFKVKMCGELIYFKLFDIYHPILCYSNCNKKILIKCLHRCLHDFFGCEIEYQWADSPKAFWGALPQNISIKHFEGYDLMMDPLKRSDFYKTECLQLHVYGSVIEDVLRNIEGRQADITCSGRFNYSKVGNFLNRVQIQDNTERNGIPKVDILNYAGCKKLDDSRYGPSHSIPFACGSNYYCPTARPFWSHNYMIRENDNLVVPIYIEDSSFIFGVWEMTETEFLELAAKEPLYLRVPMEYLLII